MSAVKGRHTPEFSGPRVWAISGGKGGTGKSFLATQLAISQASRGRSVVLVDADPQGAGVHGLLGIPHQAPAIGEYLRGENTLEECLHRTPINNLRMVFGNAGTHPLPPMTSRSSRKFTSKLVELDVDLIVMDLGGGMAPQALNLFLSAHEPIVVTMPEMPVLENFFQFCRALRFFTINRWLEMEGLSDSVEEVWKDRPTEEVVDLNDLEHYLPAALGRRIVSPRDFPPAPRIQLILNHLTSIDEVHHGFSLRSLCRKHLGINLLYAGYVENEPKAWKKLSAVQGRPGIHVTPRTRQEILRIGRNLTNGMELTLESVMNA